MKTKEKKQSRKKQVWLLVINVSLLLLIIGVTAIFIVRSDWRYGVFDLVRGRGSAKTQVLTIAAEEQRPVALADIEAGRTETDGITASRAMLLVNDQHHLGNNEPVLAEFRDTQLYLDTEVISPLEELLAANTKATGEKMLLMSTYRSAEEQAQTIEEEGSLAAAVGASEHQTGLGMDVYVAGKAQRRFIDSKSGVFVDHNGWEYGFIIRYPLFKSGETGQSYEPWHLRYVGKPHAEIIYKNRYTLESYLEKLEPGVFYGYGNYGFSLQKAEDGMVHIPASWQAVTVSPDNRGYYMITGKIDAVTAGKGL